MKWRRGAGSADDRVPVLVAAPAPPGSPPRSSSPATASRLLVEHAPHPSDLPRATVLSVRTMELLRSWGLQDDILAGGVEVDWHLLECRTLAEAAAGVPLEVGYPSRAQSAVLSPSAPECVAQDHLEPVLLRHLATLEPAEVRLGTALAGLDPDAGGVTATLRDVATGAERRVRADWLVAADGAYSGIRRRLGIAMHGDDEVFAGATATIRAPLWEVVGPHRHGIYSTTHPEMPGIFLPAGPRPVADRLPRRRGHTARAGRRARIRIGAGVADLPSRSAGSAASAPPRSSRPPPRAAARSSRATPPIA